MVASNSNLVNQWVSTGVAHRSVGEELLMGAGMTQTAVSLKSLSWYSWHLRKALCTTCRQLDSHVWRVFNGRPVGSNQGEMVSWGSHVTELVILLKRGGKEKRSRSSKPVLSCGVMSCATSEPCTVLGPARRSSPGAEQMVALCFWISLLLGVLSKTPFLKNYLACGIQLFNNRKWTEIMSVSCLMAHDHYARNEPCTSTAITIAPKWGKLLNSVSIFPFTLHLLKQFLPKLRFTF